MIYATFVGAMFILTALRAAAMFQICLNASVAVHRQLFAAIMRAPMRFFELNSVGRVLNRFSNDLGTMDEYLPELFYILIAVSK